MTVERTGVEQTTAARPRRRGGRGGRGEVAMVPEATPTSYYGHPIIKPPIWKPEVGVYLFTGGLAGASALLATAARHRGNDVLARRALLIAFAGVTVSPVLLIMDLGVPRRFLNMLRVAKVTSPMNVGTWLLSAAGASTGVAAACEVLGILPRVQRVAETSAGLLGPPLATYTAVLLSDTAVPVWHGARYELPFVFAGSALASAGAAAAVLTPARDAELARRVAVAGAVTTLTGMQVMERRLGDLAEPFHSGPVGRFARAAKLLGAGGAAALALGGRRRPVAVAGGLSVLAGAMCERWSIFTAGRVSASDPRYTVEPQRRRLASGG
ncbi:MAG TPA: NrfD/PsrC family molybdoenzyme membrane anchor subunit [Candidatus Dormibacteraeota bacterium]|jgi:formate-dependent nitrite reductase membrane component NrfD|nr:NrfD/PsrC family molybdoenzyme membrane anchor subunit [Candidatus Dormibacteraeota bacterium]